MFRTRTPIVAALAAASLLVLAGCSSSAEAPAGDAYDPDEEVSLDFAWWGNDDRANRYTELIAAFNEEYPNITINTQKPMRKTDAANTPSCGANTMPSTPTIETIPAIDIVSRSPIRATAQPAGMFPQSCPTTSADATSAAVATSAPSWAAMIGMSGMTAPSPSANSTVGP